MCFDPKRIACEYYFGDLQYWKLPRIAADALEAGYDGPALRKLGALANRPGRDIHEDEAQPADIDSAFREMGVDAPLTKETARLTLAIESAHRALNGESNVFDESTHIRIHLCELSNPPEALAQIVHLSNLARHAPRSEWRRIETDLQRAFALLLDRPDTQPQA